MITAGVGRNPRCDDSRPPAHHGLELGLCHGEGMGMGVRGVARGGARVRCDSGNTCSRRRLDIRFLDRERVRMAVGAGGGKVLTGRRSGAGGARAAAFHQTCGCQNPRQASESRP